MVSYEHWPAAIVLRRIRLGPSQRPTGRTRHYDEEGALPPPIQLVIARHDAVARDTIGGPLRPYSSYYIFYLDDAGREMTDMCEQTLADALGQAEAEFGIKPDEGEMVSETDL